MDLSGKVIVVTGAASGIGFEIARLAVEAGARVVAVDVEESLEARFEPIHRAAGDRLQSVQGDVALDATAEAFTCRALEAFGTIDVMINNAGVSVVKPIHEHAPEEWDLVFDVNVKAIYHAARHVVPVMKRHGGGLFLNTGSISSVVGIPGQGAYAPSKGAVVQITRQMAIEYAAEQIRSVAVCPGTVDTPLLRRAAQESGDPEAFLQRLESAHPIGRIASAEEIAHFYIYLSSDHARFFNGAVLMIDGGFTAQ